MPEFIVQFDPAALRRTSGKVTLKEEYLEKVLGCSKPGTLAVEPLFPGVRDKEMQTYFRVHALKGRLPSKMGDAVNQLDGVLSAYLKADASAPSRGGAK